MWNFFKRKKIQVVEPKLTPYEKKKKDAIKNAKEKFPNFEVSDYYVNATLNDFIFIDTQNKQIGIYKTVSPFHVGPNYGYAEQQMIPFINLEEVGISYGAKTVMLWRDVDSLLMIENQNFEELLNEFEQQITPDVNIMLYVREKSEDQYGATFAINILVYDNQNKWFNFAKNVNDTKRMFALLAGAFQVGEKEAIEKRKKEEYNATMNKIEEQTKKLETYATEECEPLLTDLLREWEFIVNDLNDESKYLIDLYDVSLELLGVKEDILYLGCKPEKVDYLNISQIKTFMDVYFRKRGFRSLVIVSNQEAIGKTMLDSNEQGERIFKEVSNMFYWGNYETEGVYRTYQDGKLFINYDGEDLEAVRDHCRYQVKSHATLTSVLCMLTGNGNIDIFIVNSRDSIEPIPISELERLWDTIKQNIAGKLWQLNEEGEAAFQSSKIASCADGILSYYYPQDNRSVALFEYQLRHEVLYYFYIHTGRKGIDIEIIENPEIGEEETVLPAEISHWIAKLEHRHVHLFKVFGMRESNDFVVIFVDEKVYIQNVNDTTIEDTPRISNLIKKHVHIYDGYFSKCIYIQGIEFAYDLEFAKQLQDYVTELDRIQQTEKEQIQASIAAKENLLELVGKLYNKEIKNRFRPRELDQIVDGDHDVDEAIRKFSTFLLKKGFVKGKDFLIKEVIREQIVQVAIKDLSSVFLHQNGTAFAQIDETGLEECLAVYHKIDFANVENDDHLFLFMCFLLQHEKVSRGTSYFELMSDIRQLLYENGEEGELNEYEEYLMSDDDETYEYMIEMVDRMDGYQFEEFVADLFHRMGYNTEITQSSGDYGLDVIAKKKGVSLGIQAKCYSGKVPNKAVQEAIAGIAYYRLDKGMVVTNSYFTKQAERQAASSNIELWDRAKLSEKIKELY